MLKMEFTPKMVDERFDEMPESGDEIQTEQGTHIIKTVNIVNKRKLLLVTFKKRDVKVYENLTDHSLDWEKDSEVINDFLKN